MMTETEKANIEVHEAQVDAKSTPSQPAETQKKDDNTDADALKKLEEKIESLEKEAKDSYDRFLRISAEFENYKKRSARETEDFRKYANETLFKAFLPVVDNLERAVQSASSENHANHSIVEGVDLTLKEILKIFDMFAVTPIESLEKPFDPAFHQAVFQEETEARPENVVIKELQKGYMMKDRLLRPAMVVVSKARKKEDDRENKTKKKITSNNVAGI
jgi:molecular chaperone GrpE